MRVFIKKYSGVEISVIAGGGTDDGKFVAKIGGAEVKRNSVDAIEKLIQKRKGSISLYLVSPYHYRKDITKVNIVAFVGSRPVQDHGAKLTRYDNVYDLSEADVKILKDMQKQEEKLNKDWEKFMGRMEIKLVTDLNFDAVRERKRK